MTNVLVRRVRSRESVGGLQSESRTDEGRLQIPVVWYVRTMAGVGRVAGGWRHEDTDTTGTVG